MEKVTKSSFGLEIISFIYNVYLIKCSYEFLTDEFNTKVNVNDRMDRNPDSSMTWLSKCDRNSRVSLVKMYPFIYIDMKLAHLTRKVMVRSDIRRDLLYNNLKFG